MSKQSSMIQEGRRSLLACRGQWWEHCLSLGISGPSARPSGLLTSDMATFLPIVQRFRASSVYKAYNTMRSDYVGS